MLKGMLITFLTSCATFGAQTTVKAAAKGIEIGVVHVAHVLHHPKHTAIAVVKHVTK